MSEPLTAAARVAIARHPQRPNITDYIEALFTDFFEQKGDRLCGEDAAILGGVALYHGRPVTVIGTRKGKTLEENLKCNFGMPNPEGYRKALRLMRQAEKFHRPILTFIDTSGAYPGMEAEARITSIWAMACSRRIYSGWPVSTFVTTAQKGTPEASKVSPSKGSSSRGTFS